MTTMHIPPGLEGREGWLHLGAEHLAQGASLAGPRPRTTGTDYTVILASGREDGGKRATLALSMACTALSMDLRTFLFLAGEGSYWAYQGHAEGIQVPGFPALVELLDSFVDLGGNLAVCSTCNQALCHASASPDVTLKRLPGVQVQGMAAVMEHLVRGQAVTF